MPHFRIVELGNNFKIVADVDAGYDPAIGWHNAGTRNISKDEAKYLVDCGNKSTKQNSNS